MFTNLWREYFENILLAIFLALFVRTFVLTSYKVTHFSMSPLLLPGDFIFSYRLPFGVKIPLTGFRFGEGLPEKGELIVFSYPEQPRVQFVKRVIGLPGDRIEMKGHELHINALKLQYQPLSLGKNDSSASAQFGSLPLQEFDSYIEVDGDLRRTTLVSKKNEQLNLGPLIVPPGEVFVLADNRHASDESRYWGTVPIKSIEGRVLLVWFSLNWDKKWAWGLLPTIRTERIFSTVR